MQEANGNLFIFDHPLIQHKVSKMRDVNTSTKEFRELVNEVALLMGYEVYRDLPLKKETIETPITTGEFNVIGGKKLALVPIMRAGLGMVDGMLGVLPTAKVGHIGLYRDPETLEAVEYYCKLPDDSDQRTVILLDPMLATGVSAAAAVDFLKERGVTDIKFVCIISAPEGIQALQEAHPDVKIYAAACDEGLDENKYIVPGLGDAGDRLFGTK